MYTVLAVAQALDTYLFPLTLDRVQRAVLTVASVIRRAFSLLQVVNEAENVGN